MCGPAVAKRPEGPPYARRAEAATAVVHDHCRAVGDAQRVRYSAKHGRGRQHVRQAGVRGGDLVQIKVARAWDTASPELIVWVLTCKDALPA